MPMVCLKDDCFCSRESCDEYDICNERKLQEQTNEEWFDNLPTEEKAKIMIRLVNNLEKRELIAEWLKEKHR